MHITFHQLQITLNDQLKLNNPIMVHMH